MMDVDADLLHPYDPARRFAAMAWLRENEPVHRIGEDGGPLYLASRAAVGARCQKPSDLWEATGPPEAPLDRRERRLWKSLRRI